MRDILTELKLSESKKKRTHDEKIKALWNAFERFKIKAVATGLVNDCSVKKVCAEACVNDVYLHTSKLKSDDINAKYHSVTKAINEFRKKFSETNLESEYSLILKSKNEMGLERDKAHKQYRDALEQVIALKSLVKNQNDKLKAHNLLAVNIAHSNLEQRLISKNQPIVFTEAKIVSPDSHLFKNGQYSYHDKNVRDSAWRTARHEIEGLLKRPLPMRVYMMIGAPCSGKTYWSGQSNYYNDRHPVIIDATNLTKSDRSFWFNTIYECQQTNNKFKLCAVFFDTPLNILIERNNKRPPDKRLPDDDIREKFQRLEPVDVFEGFNEILVVKHG
jgi:predicted kinase